SAWARPAGRCAAGTSGAKHAPGRWGMKGPVQAPRRRCGAVGQPDGSVTWRVWAPRSSRGDLVLQDDRRACPMAAEGRGYFRPAQGVAEGQRYAFSVDGGPERPDPCSLWQPEGVHGPSAVVLPANFGWTDQAWPGLACQDLVFYELHVGTFTPEGTFDA